MTSKDKDIKETKEMVKLRHKLVFDIEQRFEQFSLNTVISGFMEYNNKLIDLAKKEGASTKKPSRPSLSCWHRSHRIWVKSCGRSLAAPTVSSMLPGRSATQRR